MGIGDIQKKIHWLVYEKGKLLVDWALHGEIWVWIPTQKQNEIKMMNQRNKLLCIVYAYFLEMEVYKFTQKKKKERFCLFTSFFMYDWENHIAKVHMHGSFNTKYCIVVQPLWMVTNYYLLSFFYDRKLIYI